MTEKRPKRSSKSPPKAETSEATEVTPNGTEEKTTEPLNDKTAEQASGEAESDASLDMPFSITIELPNDKSVELSVSPMELVQELHQRLQDMQETCHRTCFHLTFEGTTLDNFIELKSVENLKDGSIVKVIEEPYTQRKAKIHIRHLRDLINSLSQADVFFGQDLTSPSFLNILTGGDIIARNVDASKSVHSDVDCTPPSYIMPGVKDTPLAGLLLESEEQQKKLTALKTLTLSGWNPPPGPRKLRGDLLYLYVTSLEEKSFHITASTKGFYVNCSTEESFDPKRHSAKGSQTFHSLVELLNGLSPLFKKNFALIQKVRCGRNDLERYQAPYQLYSWLAPSIDHSLDAIRAEDASSYKFGYEEQIPGQTRDWNDELQSTKELPKETIAQRVIRERAVFKVNADFVGAATRGAMAVVDGNVLALNPGEDFRSQMFIWNNIFFSLGFDVRDHYKDVGGDAAAHIALSNDLKGVQAYFTADVDGLYTLGTVVVDYRGYRVMAQSIIPGILEKEQDQSVVYGSIDSGKTVVTHEKYEELLNAAAVAIKANPHGVVDAEGKLVTLASSIECKGIIGDDNRHYILDLMRTFPPDVNFLIQDRQELSKELRDLGFPRGQRHKLASLRQELIEHFVEQKYVLFVKNCAMQYHAFEKQDQQEKSEAKSIENKESTDEVKPKTEESKGTPADGALDDERKKEILRKACAAVNSLSDDEFCIRFNADAFLDHVRLSDSDMLLREQNLIVEAAEFLVTTQIPALVREANDHSASIVDGVTLTNAMHTKGINVRYLGLLTKFVAAETHLSYVHRICVQEMIVRSAKHIFHSYLQWVEGHTVAQSVAHFLNCLLSAKLPGNFAPACVIAAAKGGKNRYRRGKGTASPTSSAAISPSATTPHVFVDWTSLTPKSLFEAVKSEISEYFHFDCDADSFDGLYTRYEINRLALLRGFTTKTGVQLLQKNYALATGLANGAFAEDDIVNLYPIVKHMEPRATDAFVYYVGAQNKIQQGYLKDGFELIAESHQLMNQVYGPMHIEIVQGVRLLARLSYIMGDHEAALMHQQRAVIMSERVSGFDSPETIQEYGSLALYSFACGQVSTTLKVLYRMRYLLLIVCGEKHPDMATLDANIGLVLYALRQYELALSFLESSQKLHTTYYGDKSMKTALSHHLVARTQSCLGDFRGALKSEKETYAIYRSLLGDGHDKTKESSECLRHLTQQAVVLQKQINELSDTSNMPKNANKLIPPITVTPPPMANVLDLLNVINGIIFVQISSAEIEALRAELVKKAVIDEGDHGEEGTTNETNNNNNKTAHQSNGKAVGQAC